MAESRTSIINYDFNWEIEHFTAGTYKRFSKLFFPLEGKVPVFDFFGGQLYNPSFLIYFERVGHSREKEICEFHLCTNSTSLLKEFRVQFKIAIRSVSNALAEYSSETYKLDYSTNLELCTVFTKGATLSVFDKVIGFSREYDFVAIKCQFKIMFVDPVIRKSTITPAQNVSRERRCNLCLDFKNLYESKKMADVTITVGDISLLAHKLVLATRSHVFTAMLDNDCLESNTKTIQITDIDAPVFEYFLKYLYCSEIGDRSFDTVRNLYMLADKYLVDSLKEDCRDILEVEMKEGTVCQLLELSHLFMDTKLKEKAVEFIKQHFTEVSKKSEWLKICKDFPELASDVLRMVTVFLDTSKPKLKS